MALFHNDYGGERRKWPFLKVGRAHGAVHEKKKQNTRIECYKTQPVLEEFHDLNQQGKVFFLVVYPLVKKKKKKSGKQRRVLQIYK